MKPFILSFSGTLFVFFTCLASRFQFEMFALNGLQCASTIWFLYVLYNAEAK